MKTKYLNCIILIMLTIISASAYCKNDSINLSIDKYETIVSKYGFELFQIEYTFKFVKDVNYINKSLSYTGMDIVFIEDDNGNLTPDTLRSDDKSIQFKGLQYYHTLVFKRNNSITKEEDWLTIEIWSFMNKTSSEIAYSLLNNIDGLTWYGIFPNEIHFFNDGSKIIFIKNSNQQINDEINKIYFELAQ